MCAAKPKKVNQKQIAPTGVRPAGKEASRSTREEPVLEKAVWEDELNQLNSKSFNSLEDAISELCDLAMAKMKESDPEVKKFLVTLIETDPSIKERLSSLLRIKRG